jgi:hypothetical protein
MSIERSDEGKFSQNRESRILIGVNPIRQRVVNGRKREYIILYHFSESWKKRRPGSGGNRKNQVQK